MPGEAGDGGLPTTRSDVYAPPAEDVQVADVFYEDTVSGSTVPNGPAAAPGEIWLRGSANYKDRDAILDAV